MNRRKLLPFPKVPYTDMTDLETCLTKFNPAGHPITDRYATAVQGCNLSSGKIVFVHYVTRERDTVTTPFGIQNIRGIEAAICGRPVKSFLRKRIEPLSADEAESVKEELYENLFRERTEALKREGQRQLVMGNTKKAEEISSGI